MTGYRGMTRYRKNLKRYPVRYLEGFDTTVEEASSQKHRAYTRSK